MPASLVAVLANAGITTPTPIQAATLPDSLAGRDVLGRGRTGSGKTYAFLLPLLARLDASRQRPRSGKPRALILAPTRELATQIDASLAPLAKALRLSSVTIFGGVSQNPQVAALRRGVDVVVACPGRLEDLMNQGHCNLGDVEVTVLDEADHMADMGFLPGVRRILNATPADGQRLLFSATLDAAVDSVVKRYLHKPVTHEADSPRESSGTMEHRVLRVSDAERLDVLVDLTSAPGRTVVFTRTKSRAKRTAKQLNAAGVAAVELHGNLSQNARTRALDAFGSGAVQTLVATDIAARGIHVDEVGLVIHADPPVEHKAYLHRSGRTARAGASGTVVTLMTPDQTGDVRGLLRKAGIKATVTHADNDVLHDIAPGERVLGAPVTTPAVASAPQAGRGRGNAGGSTSRPKRGNRRVADGADAPRDGAARPGGESRRNPGGADTGAGRPRRANGSAGSGRTAPRPAGQGSRRKGEDWAAVQVSTRGEGRSAAQAGGRRDDNRPAQRSRRGAAPRGTAVASTGGRATARTTSAHTTRSGGGAAAFSASTSAGRRR
ncbi:MAG: DEAD/DEAH box helicase [Dermatophilus congolensis]|nr:DEAD/DEAH box helicase [Dermatophilus congolensis]